MKRKRNKSRLTRTDVDTICTMQRKIDFYERYIEEVSAMILSGKVVPILEGEFSSIETATIYNFVKANIERNVAACNCRDDGKDEIERILDSI